jgi:uncharacterized phiE125 gp8 family phage protein
MVPDHGLTLVVAPTSEPVTLGHAKSVCRVDTTDRDAEIAGYILAARQDVERITGRAIVTQTWRMTMDAFPAGAFELPLAPVASVTSITYTDAGGAEQTVAGANYALDATTTPARIALVNGASWPTTAAHPGAVKVLFVAGYDTASVPEPLRMAIALLTRFYLDANADDEKAAMRLLDRQRVHWQ